MTENKNTILPIHIPTDADYERAELDLLRAALKRSYTERFLVMTKLMKRNEIFKKAKIIHVL